MGLFAIRPDERRDAWAAFFTLFGLIGSHTILETARDAMFLAKVPASRLPWVFLLVAALSFLVARVQSVVAGRLSGRPALAVFALAAGLVTFGFYLAVDTLGAAGLYALYVWSGLLTTLLLVHFWTLLGNLFSVTQAKRLYGFIGAGSVLGAIFGSGLASALARIVRPQSLLLASAVGFAIASALPFLFHDAARALPSATERTRPSLASHVKYIRESLYARRVVAVLLLSTVTLTLADFLFKSLVAKLVPAAELGAFLGLVYFVLNVASLACQLLLVSRLLKRVSLGAALAVLPVLLAASGVGIAAVGGLAAVLALRGADGSLRYSLHRTATELLFLPFSDEARARVKGFMDVVGQRGGQVVASLALLGLAAMGTSPRVLAIVLVVVAAGWAALALALREPYIELFRARLKTGRLTHLEAYPDLDLASLETLIAALDSRFDDEVLAALGVLEREGKVHLIPALILYHPAEAVVERALGLFTRAKRTNVVHVIDRVLEHASPRVRAATIAARSVLAPDARALFQLLEREASAEVRASITVNLIASGDIHGADAKERIDDLLLRGTPRTKVALAEAIATRDVQNFDDVLIALATAPEPDVRCAAVDAMGRVVRDAFVDVLIERLGEEVTRPHAQEALVQYGELAMRGLARALEASDTLNTLRWRIPLAMALVDPKAAATELLAWLPSEPEGSVRFQIIRALERIVRRNPDLVLDADVLQKTIDQTVQRAFRSLDSRLVLARGAEEEPRRKTTGHELLRTTLRHKEINATERLFRLLGLAFPTEDFTQIHRQLGGTKDQRATSLELIDSILANPLRAAVRGLVDELTEDEWALVTRHYAVPRQKDYAALLDGLKDNESEVVREVARFHLQELAG